MENEINIPTMNKNLFDSDVGRQINKEIMYIDNSGYRIIGIELNQRTLTHLKERGIYGFKNMYGKDIKTIINNNLMDFQLEIHREKRDKATEYVPYEVERKD